MLDWCCLPLVRNRAFSQFAQILTFLSVSLVSCSEKRELCQLTSATLFAECILNIMKPNDDLPRGTMC